MTRIKYILIVTAILAAIGTTYWYFSSYRPKSKATDYIANLLNDPGSAQFRDVRIVESTVACGEVNGKNLLGAYVGFKPFVFNSTLSYGFIGDAPAPMVSGDSGLDVLGRIMTETLTKDAIKCK